VDEEWLVFIEKRTREELDQIIADEGVKQYETRKFVADAFRDGEILSGGIVSLKLCHLSRASPETTITVRRNKLCWKSCLRSLSGILDWQDDTYQMMG